MGGIIVNIKKIKWIGEGNSQAEILFDLNEKQFWAFCHPCDFSEGEMTKVCLSFIEEEVSETAFWNENIEQNKEVILADINKLRYYCYGYLKSIHPVIIDCGAFDLSFGDWINDEREIGSFVYFVISRLDINRA